MSKKTQSPSNVRVKTVSVTADLSTDWNTDLDLIGNTESYHCIRKAGDLFQPKRGLVIPTGLVLLNFPDGGSWKMAEDWIRSKKQNLTYARHVLSLVKERPHLHQEFGMKEMVVASTKPCIYNGLESTCCVWWNDSQRGVELETVTCLGRSNCWFAYWTNPFPKLLRC